MYYLILVISMISYLYFLALKDEAFCEEKNYDTYKGNIFTNN